MRRRNVPCSPCGSGSSSGCGCCPPKSIKKINNIEPDDNGKFEIRAGTNVTITDITNGIEISSAGSAEDVVKSVNGELPDADGDVTVDTGVMTVNGVSADADGEVTITAGSNITITPDADTNTIEISASGSAEWVEDTTYKWAYLIDNGETTKEILIWKQPSGTNYSEEMVYIPKGTPTSGYSVLMEYLHIDGTIGVTEVTLSNLLMDFRSGYSSVTISQSTISGYQSGNGINEKVSLVKNFSQTSISANNFHIYVR